MPRKKEENRVTLSDFLIGKTITGIEKSPKASKSDNNMKSLSLTLDTGDKIEISSGYSNITLIMFSRETQLQNLSQIIENLQKDLDKHWAEKKQLESSIKKHSPRGIEKQL
ncbi:MAG TPA: hypothetical protein P5136_00140 [Methanofastidiosum sp.]|nr:hypothetical protein [Methanofastidiosum sp.]